MAMILMVKTGMMMWVDNGDNDGDGDDDNDHNDDVHDED